MLSWRSHRYKIRPTDPPQQHFRDKIRPAPQKWPIIRDFGPAGRVLSRRHRKDDEQGELCLAPKSDAGLLGESSHAATVDERSPPGPVIVVPGKQQAPENSHVIRLKEVSTNAENVAIPTRRIKDLKQSQGNYVRNW